MQLCDLKPKTKPKKKKRVGRGGKKGTYSGRGIKGQKSRSGRKLAPIIRELIKRYPKKRGYKHNPILKNLVVEVSLKSLNEKFSDGETVSPKSLIEKNVIDKKYGKIPQVKILANGEISKKLTIKDCKISKSAREKIEKAGGKVL